MSYLRFMCRQVGEKPITHIETGAHWCTVKLTGGVVFLISSFTGLWIDVEMKVF